MRSAERKVAEAGVVGVLVPAEDWLRERPIRECSTAEFGTHDYAFFPVARDHSMN